MSTFTTAKGLELVARGGDVGTWDTPTNSNWSIVDAAIGQQVTIGLNNSNVTLSSPQFQCSRITFNSTLTGSVNITFPTSVTGFYYVYNLCSGTSAYTVTLTTTNAGGNFIGCPPGEVITVFNDGTDILFTDLGRVGSYWDYAGSSVPNWVGACAVKPYLNCDGTTFSSATYPALATILGGNTLPNSKGRVRFALDQGAGLISTGVGGFNIPTVGGVAGSQTVTLATSNLPAYTPSGTISAVSFAYNVLQTAGGNQNVVGNIFAGTSSGNVQVLTSSPTFTGSAQGGAAQAFSNLEPAYIGGLTLIRSA